MFKVGVFMKYRELYEEYSLLLSKRVACLDELLTLKNGYISIKAISGIKYHYLQKKSDNKIISEYIKKDTLPLVKLQLQRRSELETQISHIDEQLNRLETAVLVLDKGVYHKLTILRRCSIMDSMPIEARKISLEFGNAMTALVGIPASEETEKSLMLWTSGQASFKDGYMQALSKHNLIVA